MPKPNKSSASSGTRKKHMKKAGKGDEADPGPSRPKQRGEKKLSKAQRKALPKVKQYIPPPKPPAPPIPDPLDGQGLAHSLPAELVVVLRRLGKKDGVTRRKGLEDLREGWVAEVARRGLEDDDEAERELKEETLLAAVPVWMHNLASLLQSPFHRSLALQIHNELLNIPSSRTAILDTLTLSLLPETQNRDVLGSWLVAALEEGRRAGGAGMRTWTESTSWSAPNSDAESAPADIGGKIDLTPQISTMVEYLSLSILDPPSLHDDIHPSPVSSTPVPSKDAALKGQKGKFIPATPTAQPSGAATEDEELAEERWARYRVGGLVGFSWLLQELRSRDRPLPVEIRRLLQNGHLWTVLSSTSSPDDMTLGGGQPTVRRAAYALLATLVDAYPDEVAKEDLLGMLAESVLGCCWAETEASVWETAGPAVVKFLSKNRTAWEVAPTAGASSGWRDSAQPDTDDRKDVADEDEENDDDDGSDSDNDGEEDPPAPTLTPISTSQAFNAFLDFISTTCPTLPHLTYPLLLVIISTIPPSILPLVAPPSQPLQSLLAHLWSALDARLLATHALPGQLSALQSYLRDVGDCIMFLIARAVKLEGGQGMDTAKQLVKEDLGKMWDEGVLVMGGKGGRRGAARQNPEVEAKGFGELLVRLVGTGEGLAEIVLGVMRETMLRRCFPAPEIDSKQVGSVLPRSLGVISAVREANTDVKVIEGLDELLRGITEGCAARFGQAVAEKSRDASVLAETVVGILWQYPDLVSADVRNTITSDLQRAGFSLLDALAPELTVSILGALAATNTAETGDLAQQILWSLVDSSDVNRAARFTLTERVLGETGGNANLLAEGVLDTISLEATQAALADDEQAGKLAASCLTSHGHISADAVHTILALVSTCIHDSVADLLSSSSDAAIPSAALEIFAAYMREHPTEVVRSEVYARALVAVHHLIAILPRMSGVAAGGEHAAEKVWTAVSNLSVREQRGLRDGVYADLRDLLGQVESRVNPDVLIDVGLMTSIGELSQPTTADVISDLLPPLSSIVDLLSGHSATLSDPTLIILDPLSALSPSNNDLSPPSADFDMLGRSRTARYAEAILSLLRTDRRLAETEPALLHITLASKTLASDALSVPGSSRGLYSASTSRDHLSDVIREADGALSFALASVDEVDMAWHQSTVQLLRSGPAADAKDLLQRLLLSLQGEMADKKSDTSARVFRDVLSKHLRQSGAGEKVAEVWLSFGMTQTEKASTLSQAIMLAIKPLLLDTKPLEVAQNRLANSLTGLPLARGLPALKLLLASAPPADSPSLFLPQQRAVFVLRHLTSWLTSDDADEMDEEVEIRIAELYTTLAPVVQDLSGGHWDSIFDLMESGLEGMELGDKSTLPLGYRCLVLLREIRDLCGTNKALRALWLGKDAQMGMVLRLFLQCRDADSVPMQMIQEVLLDLLNDVPQSVMEGAGLPELCDLLKLSTSPVVQCAAYRILNEVVKQRTIALVLEVEASVSEAEDGQATRRIALPLELVSIVEAGLSAEWQAETSVSSVLGQLLAWMAILDHFDDASRTLRWAYLDQLASSKLVDGGLVPMLFAMMGVSEMGAWNFPASQYGVDEFYPDLLEPEDLADLVPLASHLFYRSLVTIPLPIRRYYESLKDRQLSMSMLTFTARHYSPIIIAHEFSALREPSSMAQLTEEGLNVKIAQGGGATMGGASGSAEAIASYVVDEQPMEIGIRLPAEFPLKGVEIRDLRRVGVPENKWRGWLMSVQQTITSRNGLILEALTVFKKNVSLHFEGVVECAICYSIISLTDRTLPTKPCRTCKNRFHASCLFKWFNSSHTSSCPLCRSLF